MAVIFFAGKFMGNHSCYGANIHADVVTLANKLLADKAIPENLVKLKVKTACSRYVIHVKIAGQGYYFKKFINHSLKLKIKQALTMSSAEHSYHVSTQLISKGISVASPILCSKKKYMGLVTESIFVTKEIEGVEATRAYRLEKGQLGKQLMLEKYSELGLTLIVQGFFHLDFRLGNMMLCDNDFVLFDVDDVYFTPLVKFFNMIKMLSKINLMFLLGRHKGVFPEGVGCKVVTNILRAANFPFLIEGLIYKFAMAHSQKDFRRLRKKLI